MKKVNVINQEYMRVIRMIAKSGLPRASYVATKLTQARELELDTGTGNVQVF